MGTLFLVATPIGNLKDITLRAVKTLGSVDAIACEDTRRTGLLLKKLEIKTGSPDKPKLLSYFEHNERKRIPQIISLLRKGQNVALVSNAGTPTVSDPGFKLVRECLGQGIKVETVPGASAILAALTSSGLPTDKFLFLGFLPKKKAKREKIFQNLTSIRQFFDPTIIFFESPMRLTQTLTEIKKTLGNIEIAICRELTKIHEEIKKGKTSDLIEYYHQKRPKGEITIVLDLTKD